MMEVEFTELQFNEIQQSWTEEQKDKNKLTYRALLKVSILSSCFMLFGSILKT